MLGVSTGIFTENTRSQISKI